eukprot:6175949-Pleurochrysis_carterae.AAC.2
MGDLDGALAHRAVCAFMLAVPAAPRGDDTLHYAPRYVCAPLCCAARSLAELVASLDCVTIF